MTATLLQVDPRQQAMLLDRALTAKPKIPQLEDTTVRIYGHSQAAVLGGSYATSGRHWSQLLAETNIGSVVNSAIAGTTMEQATLTMAYSGNSAQWPFDANKKLALIVDVYNTAGATITASKATHLTSMKKAVETICAYVCSDWVSHVNVSPWTYSGGWATTSYPYSFGGSHYYTVTPGAYGAYTVPAGITNKRIWAIMSTIDYRQTALAPVRFTRNDGAGAYDLFTQTMSDHVDNSTGYGHRAVDLGVYSTGQSLAVVHAGTNGQYMYFNGLLIENGKNHACFTEDNPDWAAPGDVVWASWQPGFDAARIEEFNQALREQVADFNTRVPNGASTIVMQDRSVWQADTAQANYAGTDRVHINDRGNAYYFAKITQGLAKTIPWTSRLHSVVTTG